MIVTEEEAKTKRCQETRGGIAHDRDRTCLGSECMAWRWFDNTSDEAIKEPRGFCGKAGHP